MVSLLLSKGANVNANDKKERKAIHWAAYHGNWCSDVYIYVESEYKYKKELMRIFTKLKKRKTIRNKHFTMTKT